MRVYLITLLLCVACSGDRDNDGLSNADERRLGTGTAIADTDGDGLLDGEEVHEYGTDPLQADGDHDGFDDLAEVQAGTDSADPLDYPRDTIGSWPDLREWAPDDDDTGFSIGERLPSFTAVDQFGNQVDSYQFFGHVILLRLQAGSFCSDCAALASTDQATLDRDWDRGLAILHLLVDDDNRDGTIEQDTFMSTYADRHDLQLPVLHDKSMALPVGLNGEEIYTGQIPLTLLIDRHMRLDSVYVGKREAEAAESTIATLLRSAFPGE